MAKKTLILPAEHGTWSWLLVPYGVGVGVAGRFDLAALLVLVGGLSAFFARQPATVWLRVRQGRGRAADGPAAARWTAGLAILALLCLVVLLALGRTAVLWLAAPLVVVMVFYLAAARLGRAHTRSLWMEVAGAAGLAGMAPAAYVAATGRLDNTAWALWIILAVQNVLGVLYVRLRIADTHQRPLDRATVLAGHAIGLAAVALAGLMRQWPWLFPLPFIGFLARAAWAVARPRPIAAIKRFGFTEVGVEIASGLYLIATLRLLN
ncbi:MAG: YwiC-like family protein [Chloroflexota bacterium]